MASELNFESIQINPASLQWGNQSMQKVVVTTASALTLGGKWFALSSVADEYYVWLNTGASTDPAVAGKTGVEVDISLATTITQVAAAIATEIDALADFHAKSYTEGGVTYVLTQAKEMGACAAAVDGAAATTFTFSEVRAGSLLDIGLTEDLEVGFAVSTLDVTASQFGTTVLERLKNGMNVETIAVNMKESVAAKIKSIMQPHFPAVTPAGVGATAVQGVGNSLDFTNVSSVSAKLVFHPIKLADNDLSEDWAYFRASPMLKKLNFSGESEQMISVEFSVLPDKYMLKSVQHGVYGDHTQNFLK